MSNSDSLKKFLTEDRAVRVIAVSLQQTWQTAQTHQPESPAVRQLLGELVACAALLTANLKFNGSLLLQLRGNGPVKLVVVECRNDLSFRATAKLRRDPDPDETGLKALLNADGLGQFAVILNPPRDTPGVQPYQGVVPLSGDSVADAVQMYMQQSEQLETSIQLSATPGRVAGLLVQQMPTTGGHPSVNEREALSTWQHVQALCSTVSTQELATVDIDALTHRLFWQTPVVGLQESVMTWRCGCDRERVSVMLRSLGQQEVQEIVTEQGLVTVTCEFCGTPYQFDAVDAASLFKHPVSNESQVRH